MIKTLIIVWQQHRLHCYFLLINQSEDIRQETHRLVHPTTPALRFPWASLNAGPLPTFTAGYIDVIEPRTSWASLGSPFSSIRSCLRHNPMGKHRVPHARLAGVPRGFPPKGKRILSISTLEIIDNLPKVYDETVPCMVT